MSFIKSVAVLMAVTPIVVVAAVAESDSVSTPAAIESAAPAGETESAGQPAENAPAADANENEQAAKKVAEKEDKKICKYVAAPGSRLGRKVCMAKDEWDQIRKDSQEGVSDLQRKNTAPGLPQG